MRWVYESRVEGESGMWLCGYGGTLLYYVSREIGKSKKEKGLEN